MAESNPDTVSKLEADLTRSVEIGKELLEQQQALIEEIEVYCLPSMSECVNIIDCTRGV